MAANGDGNVGFLETKVDQPRLPQMDPVRKPISLIKVALSPEATTISGWVPNLWLGSPVGHVSAVEVCEAFARSEVAILYAAGRGRTLWG